VHPTEIRALEVTNLDVPLREPFGISRGTQETVKNLLVTVELASGARGLGEAAPLPAFNGETQDTAREGIMAARGAVLGRDARGFRRLAHGIGAATRVGSARCAVEMAILDALTRHHGMSLLSFFGGAESSLETDVTIPTGDVGHAARAAAKRREEGFSCLKIKVGGDGDDLERVSAASGAAPGASLILDANAAMTADAAIALVRALEARGVPIALFEQPVPAADHAGLAAVGRVVPVAADESVSSARDALALVSLGAPHAFNVKLMKTGIVEALDIAAIARAGGMRLMIGGMVETVLAMTTSACFAAGLGGFSFVDLDTPLFLAENPFDGGFAQRGPSLDLSSISAGHGVSRRELDHRKAGRREGERA
jgi:L-alanine-DL-glutamate epimerase-like enolase superfamily enzyme